MDHALVADLTEHGRLAGLVALPGPEDREPPVRQDGPGPAPPPPSDIISPPRALRRPPDAGKWQDRACLVVGLVVDLDVVADEVVEIEQPYGDGCAVGFVAGLLGEAAGRDVEAVVPGAQPADAALRAEAKTRALKLALQTLGDLTGPGINYFDFDNVGYVMTATEVSSDN